LASPCRALRLYFPELSVVVVNRPLAKSPAAAVLIETVAPAMGPDVLASVTCPPYEDIAEGAVAVVFLPHADAEISSKDAATFERRHRYGLGAFA
jgi:hypothetical protein